MSVLYRQITSGSIYLCKSNEIFIYTRNTIYCDLIVHTDYVSACISLNFRLFSNITEALAHGFLVWTPEALIQFSIQHVKHTRVKRQGNTEIRAKASVVVYLQTSVIVQVSTCYSNTIDI